MGDCGLAQFVALRSARKFDCCRAQFGNSALRALYCVAVRECWLALPVLLAFPGDSGHARVCNFLCNLSCDVLREPMVRVVSDKAFGACRARLGCDAFCYRADGSLAEQGGQKER
jgi:hypothetical protein